MSVIHQYASCLRRQFAIQASHWCDVELIDAHPGAVGQKKEDAMKLADDVEDDVLQCLSRWLKRILLQ